VAQVVRTFQYSTYPDVDPRFTSFDIHPGPPAGDCARPPVIVWVHGGAWSGGDKGNPETLEKAEYARSLGASLIALNYRLANRYGKGMWPDYAVDVADALTFIGAHADELGVDTSRIVLLGHSAGGQIVSIVASDPKFLAERGLPPDTIDCVISNDTEGYRLDDPVTATREYVSNAFGTDPVVLAEASPSVQVERTGAPSASFLVITRGSERRREVATEFATLVNTAGGDAVVLDAGDLTHAEVNRVLGSPGETVVTPVVTDFVTRCLNEAG
jgi:acetyl esterase/lipase